MKLVLWRSRWMSKGELAALLGRDVRDLERAERTQIPVVVSREGQRLVYDVVMEGQRWQARRIE
jgi:phage terminase Nu1 subunit (DNA packaging protein)